MSESLGMYGDNPKVTIGKFTITRQAEKRIWIEIDSGEGSEFSEDKLAAHIEKYYNDNF
jgi:hypothetical protein